MSLLRRIFGLDRATPDVGADAAHGVLTPGRKDAYERAMRQRGTKAQFYQFADQFEKYGLPLQARTLRARGDARVADKATHDARRGVIRSAFLSRDPMKVEEIAHVAETKLGMTESASRLRDYAKGLREAAALSRPTVPFAGDGSFPIPPDVSVTGDGGTLASKTQLHGESAFGLEGPHSSSGKLHTCAAGAECLVHTTGGGCSVGAKDEGSPPPVDDKPAENIFDKTSGF
jgi:hypothetical protein